MSGLMPIRGESGGQPQNSGIASVDLFTVAHAITALLSAFRQRDQTGHGWQIVTSLPGVATSMFANQGMNYLATCWRLAKRQMFRPTGSTTSARFLPKGRSSPGRCSLISKPFPGSGRRSLPRMPIRCCHAPRPGWMNMATRSATNCSAVDRWSISCGQKYPLRQDQSPSRANAASSSDQSVNSSRTGTVSTDARNRAGNRTASFSVVTSCAPITSASCERRPIRASDNGW